MDCRWLLVVCLWSLVYCREYGDPIPTFNGEEEAEFGLLLPRFYSILPYMYAKVQTSMSLGESGEKELKMLMEEHEIPDFLDDSISSFDNFTGPSGGCAGCRAFIGLLEVAIKNGDYYEFEEAVFDLCYDIVNASDDLGIPEIVCPGIVTNYVPDAAYVLNVTTMDQIDICLLWNECLFNDFEPPMSEEDTLVCKPPPITAKARIQGQRSREKADLENAIKVVHLSDIHVDGYYDVGAPTDCGLPTCCRDYWPGTGFAGYWGDYMCNQPIRISDVMFQYIASLSPDYIINTGDNPPHTVWEDTFESQMFMSQILAESFNTYLPGIPNYYALGNHDIHATNLYFNERQVVRDGNVILSELFGPMGNFTQEQMDTFQYGAYYSIAPRPGLRILTYNSNFGWLENFYTMLPDRHPDYVAMKQFMEDTLENARLNGEKVILLGHHVTGQRAGNNEYSCFVTDIHARYGDVIILHLSGHKHGDLYRLVRDITTGETRGVQISSPAGGTRTDRNPSFRVFYLDPVTFDVLDADTYRVNMSLHASDPDGSNVPVVEFGYRFTEDYNMVDLSPESFEDFIIRMETDDALFERYLFNEATGNPDRVDNCDAECRFEEICQMKNTAYPGYLRCTGEIS